MISLYVGTVVATFFMAYWLAMRLCESSSRLYILDHPNKRSLHEVPTPRTGGVAIMGALYLGVLLFWTLSWTRLSPGESMSVLDSTGGWILMVTGVISVVSLVDDRWGLSIGVRLVVHLLAGILLVSGSGLVLSSVKVPLLGSISFGWIAASITVVFLVWMANLYNFMDGMDGFAGGMTVVGCGLLGYLAWQAHHPVLCVIAILQSSAAAGFLVHNLPPAKIFMGDVGSISTGFLVAALIVLGCRDGVFDIWVPFIIFSPFILDATVTLIGRVFRRERVWEAHRNHCYQRLVVGGWSHRRTVSVEYTVMALCGCLALLYQYAAVAWRSVVLGAWVLLFLFLALAVRRIEQRIQPVGS